MECFPAPTSSPLLSPYFYTLTKPLPPRYRSRASTCRVQRTPNGDLLDAIRLQRLRGEDLRRTAGRLSEDPTLPEELGVLFPSHARVQVPFLTDRATFNH